MTVLNNQITVYTGTFDPIHLGHLDVITRGSRIFKQLIIGVGINPDKAPFFTQQERVEMIEKVIKEEGLSNIAVRSFEGLAVTFVRRLGPGSCSAACAPPATWKTNSPCR